MGNQVKTQDKTQWRIMLPDGRLVGPFDTKAVLKLIRDPASNVNEECKVKQMATAMWMPLASVDVFYEALLEVMSQPQNPVKGDPAKSKIPEPPPFKAQDGEDVAPEPPNARGNLAVPPVAPPPKYFEETEIVRPDRQMAEETRYDRSLLPINDELTRPAIGEVVAPPPTVKNSKTESTSKPSGLVLDLQNISSAAWQEKIKSTKVPLAFAAAAIVLAIAVFFIDSGPGSDQLKLILPRLDRPPAGKFDEKAALTQYTRALYYYWQDTVEGHLQAQSELVPLIEKVPQFMPARGLLCLVYRELWPYVEQSKSDTEAVDRLTKSTKGLDPVGSSGAYCEVAKLLVQGRMNEARGMVDYYLEMADRDRAQQISLLESQGQRAYRFSSDPVIMSFRAELLAGLKNDDERKDPIQAAAYVQNIQKYTEKWVKMYHLNAKFLLQADRAQDAARAFEETLKLNPKHKPALIEFGIMNYTHFRQNDKALNYLNGALSSRGIITRSLESRAHYFLAKIYNEKRDVSEALAHAEKAYELNPSDNLVKNMVVELGGSVKLSADSNRNNTLVFEGDQHAREGDCLMAQALYKAAFEADSQNALAAMKAAKCLKELNRPREAIGWLEKAIKIDPSMTTAYLLLADYLSEAYNFQKAEAVLGQVARKFPNQYEILRGYGLVALRQNRLKEAAGYLERALKGYQSDIDTLILLAKTYLEGKDYQKALSYAARALELDRASVEAHIVYGRTLAPFKGLEAATNYLVEQRAQFSKNVEYPLAIAELYRETGRCAFAEKEYKAVIEWRPDTKQAHMGLGDCYFLAGNVVAALKAFFDAAYYDPSDADPFMRIGMIYISANRHREAIPQLKRALEVNEMKPLVRYYLGKAHFGLGEYKEALEWTTQEMAHHPQLADPYVLAAEVYAKMDNYKTCAEQYQKAVGLRTSNKAELYVNMARCQRQAQNLDGAQGSLDIAISLESGRPEIYREQGALFELRGDLRAAAAAYNKYLTLSPNAPDKNDVEARLGPMASGSQ